ncbi:MAG: hypothetical protein VB032_05760 [Burkholderiaceae bacterium]|nr:hypothetical protein [Burkholderiaceae bacterium]
MDWSDILPVLGLISLCGLFGVAFFCLLSNKATKKAGDDLTEQREIEDRAGASRSQCDGYSAGTFYW